VITRQLTWLPEASRGLLRGLYRVDRTATDREGRIHLLAVLEREAAAAHLGRLAFEQRGKAKAALNDCRRQLQAGELASARSQIALIEGQIGQIRTLLAAARAAVGDQARPAPFPEEQEAAELKARISEGEARRRTVLVHVLRIVDGTLTGDLTTSFRTVVSQRGLRVAHGNLSEGQVNAALEGTTRPLAEMARTQGAGYVVVGRVAARFSSEDMGQFFAWASGQIRLIETTSGRTVADLSYDHIKGGHISRGQACDQAISNAVSKLATELQQKLDALQQKP